MIIKSIFIRQGLHCPSNVFYLRIYQELGTGATLFPPTLCSSEKLPVEEPNNLKISRWILDHAMHCLFIMPSGIFFFSLP